MTRSSWLIYLWTSPTTLVGLTIAAVAVLSGGHATRVDGVLEVHGGFATFFLRRCTLLRGGASAMALGHVVIGRDVQCLNWTRPHERVHVRQAEHWGPLFIPAYLVSCVVAYMRGGNPYRDNRFEREAYGD